MEGIMTTVSNGWRSFDAIHVAYAGSYEVAYIWNRLVMTEPLNCEIYAEGEEVILQILEDDGNEMAAREVRAFLAGLCAGKEAKRN